jgi:ATP-binding cassette subfamily B protein
MALTGLLTLVEALLPAVSVWLLKQIIDTVAATGSGPGGGAIHSAGSGGTPPTLGGGEAHTGTVLALAGSYLLLVCVQQSVRAISQFLQSHVRDLLAGQVTLRVMERASAYSDLSSFETPRFHDRLQTIQREVSYRPMYLFTGLAQGLQATITLGCMLFFLASYHPLIAMVLALAAGPGVFCQRRLHEASWWGMNDLIPLRRRLQEYARILLTAPFAKEVRLFSFAPHILGRYRERFAELTTRSRRTQWRLVAASVGLSLLAALGVGGAFAYVIDRALRGAFTLGDLSLYTGALFQANAAAGALAGALGLMHETLPFMRELFGFLEGEEPDSTPRCQVGSALTPPPPLPILGEGELYRASDTPLPGLGEGQGVRAGEHAGFLLDRVAFRYPEAERSVFTDLSLEIRWGQTTAIVGENGAGKSTLVKLLTRLYDPDAGRVLLDGIDLCEYDIETLRRQIAVVFQDYARYQLPFWENVALGDITALHDRERIREAARRGGAEGLIRRLPQGEETLLGREFDGGTELSGGEWQKVALARAFMRDAPILILDEPTAALDPRAEHDLYRRFLELARGRTTLLISHRLSTVQMADRILVLEEGRVLEEGDHRALMARRGRYAELYALQADRYRQPEAGSR